MAAPKLRLVFYEDKSGIQSYFHLEKTEGLRVLAIIKLLPELKEWTPLSKISKIINARTPATLVDYLKARRCREARYKVSRWKKNNCKETYSINQKGTAQYQEQFTKAKISQAYSLC